MKQIFTLFLLLTTLFVAQGQTVYSTNFGTATSGTPPSPFNPTPITIDANLTTTGWTGGNVFFGGVAGGAYCNNASNGNGTFTLSITIAAGYKLDASSATFQMRRTSTGASVVAVSVGGTAFSVTGSPASGSFAPISATGTASNLTGLNTVTITTSGGTGTSQNVRLDDFVLIGTVSAISSNSTASNIIATIPFTPATNIDYKNFQATDITAANSIELGQFTIQDGGGSTDGDALPTTLTSLGFSIANGANLRRIAIYDGATEIAEIAGSTTANFTGLTGLSATDDGSKTFSLRATFNNTVSDNAQIVATVNSTATDNTGSGFATSNAGAAATSNIGDDNKIEVIADRLAFVQNTTTPTGTNSAMSPAPTVSANDVNNNRDLDYIANIDITSTGTLATSPTSVATVNGLATFSTPNAIIHTTNGISLQLTAASGLLTNTTSNLFNISVASAATDYFRSKQTGNWADFTTWESSSDETTWINATLIPDSNSTKITIATGNTVTINVAANADNLVVDGTLSTNVGTAFLLRINDGNTNPDMTVNGTLQLNNTYTSCWTIPTNASVLINPTGIVKIDGGSGNQAFAINTNVTWSNGSTYEWNTINIPSFTGLNYFATLANPTDIPIFRFTQAPTNTIGGGTATTVNGKIVSNVDLIFGGNSNKIIKNGFSTNGNITYAAIAGNKVIINGANAVLEGTGTITTGTGGLEIGSATGTTVSVNNNKTINGSIGLVNTALINLGNNNLTSNGLSGGSTTALVVTNGTGSLIVNNISTTPVTFPVGSSAALYTPVTITNNGTPDNYSVNVSPTYGACLTLANQQYSVQNTWNISEATTGGSVADLMFDYGSAPFGTSFAGAMAIVAHCNGTNIDYSGGVVANITQVTIGGVTSFSPFTITSDPAILPIKITSFVALQKTNAVSLKWKIAQEVDIAQYELQKSNNGNDFSTMATINAQNLSVYEAFDDQPNIGNNYYRLKIKETNGNIIYSNIQKIKFNGKSLVINNIFPIPTKDNISLTINYNANALGILKIVDINGKTIDNQEIKLVDGATFKTINLSKLSKGTYFIQLIVNNEKITEKIYKF